MTQGTRKPGKDEWDDIAVRYIVNTDDVNRESLEDFMVVLEEAYWYYLDEMTKNDPSLIYLKEFKDFLVCMMEGCEAVQHLKLDVNEAVRQYSAFKHSSPVRGAIILSEDLTKVLLVQSLNSGVWNFPKGKAKRSESDLQTAAREVYEEIGYDVSALLDENYKLQKEKRRVTKLYVVLGVPSDFPFKPKVKGEIQDIQWFSIDLLPKNSTERNQLKKSFKFGDVYMWISDIRNWIRLHRERERRTKRASGTHLDRMGSQSRSGRLADTSQTSSQYGPSYSNHTQRPSYGNVPYTSAQSSQLNTPQTIPYTSDHVPNYDTLKSHQKKGSQRQLARKWPQNDAENTPGRGGQPSGVIAKGGRGAGGGVAREDKGRVSVKEQLRQVNGDSGLNGAHTQGVNGSRKGDSGLRFKFDMESVLKALTF